MIIFKDAINFIFPVPPTILKKEGQFPDCIDLFEKISKSPPAPRDLGRLFSRLCRLTGIAWSIWGINSILFISGVLLLIFHWGNWMSKDKTELCYFNNQLSGINIISMIAALVFLGALMFNAARLYSMSLSDRCLEHLKNKPSSRRPRKGK